MNKLQSHSVMKNNLIFLFIIISTSFLNAQDIQEVSFTTDDNINIHAVYQLPSAQNASYPAIILIHQGGSSHKEWLELPLFKALLKEGYAVLAYDVRMHGLSGKDGEFGDLFNNPKRAPLDLQAAIKFLKQDKRIDTNRIGIIGTSIGANLACVASSNNYGIKSAVSLSAKTSAVQNLSGKETITPKNVFHIASKDEQGGKRDAWANELFNMTAGEKKVEVAPGNKHGSYIIKEHPYLQDEIIKWFEKTLK